MEKNVENEMETREYIGVIFKLLVIIGIGSRPSGLDSRNFASACFTPNPNSWKDMMLQPTYLDFFD